MAADIGAVRRAPIRCTRPELIGGVPVKVNVTGTAAGLVCATSHIMTGATDRGGFSVAVRIASRIDGDSGQSSDMSDVLGVSAFAANATEVIDAGIILAVARIRRIRMTRITVAATREGVAIVDGIRAVIMARATDRTAVVTV